MTTKKREKTPAQKEQEKLLVKHQFKKGQSGNPRGMPPNRILALLKATLPAARVKELRKELTKAEIDTIERVSLTMTTDDLRAIAKNADAPAYLKSLVIAIAMEMSQGRTSTVEKLRDRQFGATAQNVQLMGKDGKPLLHNVQIEIIDKAEDLPEEAPSEGGEE